MDNYQSVIEQDEKDIIARTSSNNMLCIVEYKPLSEEEQEVLEELFAVAS